MNIFNFSKFINALLCIEFVPFGRGVYQLIKIVFFDFQYQSLEIVLRALNRYLGKHPF